MKLKYYLRGLGVGIIVTALLMGYSDSKAYNRKIQAATIANQVMEQESEMETGMTQPDVEQISSEVESTEEQIEMIQTFTEENESTVEVETEVPDTETETVQEIESVASIEESIVEEETTQGQLLDELFVGQNAKESYLLNIVRGDDSGKVARKLQNAGLIDNAGEFDAFLMQHGYDKKISVGTVEIPLGSSWVEIAEKLSGK